MPDRQTTPSVKVVVPIADFSSTPKQHLAAGNSAGR